MIILLINIKFKLGKSTFAKQLIYMRKALLFLILVLCGCSLQKDLSCISDQVSRLSFTPDDRRGVYRSFEIRKKVGNLPNNNITFICEKNYIGIETSKGVFDTLNLTRGPAIYESYLTDDQYLKMKKCYFEDGSLFYVDSLSYDFTPNGLLKRVIINNSRWRESSYYWNIEYNRNSIVSKYSVYTLTDSLIVERTFDYNPHSRIVIVKTYDGKGNVIEASNFTYGLGGRIKSINVDRVREKGKSKVTYKYKTLRNYYKYFESYDSTNSRRKGYEKYEDKQLVEYYFENSTFGYSHHFFGANKYNDDGSIKERRQYNSHWADKDTSVTTFYYVPLPAINSSWQVEKTINRDLNREKVPVFIKQTVYK